MVGGEGDDQLWGSGRGAIAGCHSSLLWWGGEGDDQLWGSGLGAIAAGCHCRVPISVSYVPSIFKATISPRHARKRQ